jgi:ABC-type branched-subunit amino acid transport system permease subunit
MKELLPFVVAGAVAGSLYGLAATGLVLTYKTSGIFNFAHGALGAGTAFLFHEFRDLQHLPWPVALLLSAGVIAPLVGLAFSTLAARLEHESITRRVVATVGLLLLIQGAIQLRYGIAPLPFATSFPSETFGLFGVRVGYDQVITVCLSVAAVVLLGCLFRYSVIGLRMRAVVDNSELVDLNATDPAQVRAISWMIGAGFAGLSGILLAPTIGLDALLLTLLVVQAFGAAAIGRFHNITATFVGGVLIGVAQYLLRAPTVVDAVPGLEQLPQLNQSLSFVVLFVVLLFTRKGRFTERSTPRPPRSTDRVPRPVVVTAVVAATGVMIVMPLVYDTKVPVFTLGAVFVSIFASLFLLTEVSGQVSLCHVTFVAIGATTFAHATTGAGLPWLVGIVIAGLVAIPIGALVAVPAIRLSGLFLGLATLGFGILVEQIAYNRALMFGNLGQRTGTRPAMFGLDSNTGYFYLCSGVAVASIVAVTLIRRSRLGRLLNALADSPVALVTHGTSINVTRVLAFCTAAFIAAVAGGLYVGVVGSVSSSGVSPTALTSFNSLLWLAVVAIAGRNTVASPVLAALALIVIPSYFTSPHLAQYLTLGFGGFALLASTFGGSLARAVRDGIPGAEYRALRSPVHARAELVNARLALEGRLDV